MKYIYFIMLGTMAYNSNCYVKNRDLAMKDKELLPAKGKYWQDWKNTIVVDMTYMHVQVTSEV